MSQSVPNFISICETHYIERFIRFCFLSFIWSYLRNSLFWSLHMELTQFVLIECIDSSQPFYSNPMYRLILSPFLGIWLFFMYRFFLKSFSCLSLILSIYLDLFTSLSLSQSYLVIDLLDLSIFTWLIFFSCLGMFLMIWFRIYLYIYLTSSLLVYLSLILFMWQFILFFFLIILFVLINVLVCINLFCNCLSLPLSTYGFILDLYFVYDLVWKDFERFPSNEKLYT